MDAKQQPLMDSISTKMQDISRLNAIKVVPHCMGYTQNLNAAITRSIIEILEMIAGEFLGVITDYVRGTNESCF